MTSNWQHPTKPQRCRMLMWTPYLLCVVCGAVFLNSIKEDVLQLHAENVMLKERLVSITVPVTTNVTGNVGSADPLKDRVAALEVLTKVLSANVTDNAWRGSANAGLIQTNTQGIENNAKGIANQTVALANVTATILDIIANDIDAAVALEVPIVVARSLGNITVALQAVQTLLAEKLTSAELVFEKVYFAFPASAKPDQYNHTPWQQCNSGCCVLGGAPTTYGVCGTDPIDPIQPCPLFCNATITCPRGSVPVGTECLGTVIHGDIWPDDEPPSLFQAFKANVTMLDSGLYTVTCQDPQFMSNIADLEATDITAPAQPHHYPGAALCKRMSTFCVSLKTSTATNSSTVQVEGVIFINCLTHHILADYSHFTTKNLRMFTSTEYHSIIIPINLQNSHS